MVAALRASKGARECLPLGSNGSLIIVITSRGCTSILDYYRPLHIYHLAHKYRLMFRTDLPSAPETLPVFALTCTHVLCLLRTYGAKTRHDSI